MPRIAIIGAGSAVFARRLITDFLCTPSLCDSHIALMDISVDAVKEDFRITSKYGVDHSVADTMGPAGLFYFLRNGTIRPVDSCILFS